MTNKLAHPSPPLTVITCWRFCSHPGRLKSGGRWSGGQLTLMEVMSPRMGVRTATRWGNSLVMRSARGHHAPSMSRPRSRASVSRMGIVEPPPPNGRVIAGIAVGTRCSRPSRWRDWCARKPDVGCLVVARSLGLRCPRGGSFTVGVDRPRVRGGRRNHIACGCHSRRPRWTTADNETARV